MRRFATLNCLVDSNDLHAFRSNAVQDLRRAVLTPAVYRPNIQQALQTANFKYHRTCSYANLIQVNTDTKIHSRLISGRISGRDKIFPHFISGSFW